MKTALFVAAHADDEALGCGGTIARQLAEGDTVHSVLADGVSSRRRAKWRPDRRTPHAWPSGDNFPGGSDET